MDLHAQGGYIRLVYRLGSEYFTWGSGSFHATSLQCLKLLMKTSRGQTITIQVCLICCFDLFSLKFTNVCKKDSERTWSTRNKSSQPSGGASSFGDSSGLLFSIYSKAADEEDNKMVERWQKDADGILIFVRPCACNHIFLSHRLEYYRLVYSLPQSLPSLLLPSRT
jgi:hypothetical protein